MLNLGDLQFGLALNTRALDAAIKRVESFGNAVTNVQRAANRGADTAIAAFRKQENAVLSGLSRLKSTIATINSSSLAPQVKLDLVKQAERDYNNFTKAIANAGKLADATKFDRNVASFRDKMSDATRAVSQMSQAQRQQEQAARTAAAAQERASNQAAQASARQAAAIFQVEQRARNLISTIERSKLNIGVTTGLTDRVDSALNAFRAKASGPNLGTAQLAAFRRDFAATVNEVDRGYRQMLAGADKVPASFERWQTGLRGIGASVLLLNGHLGGMSTRVFALGSLVGQFGVIVGIAAGATAGLSSAVFGLGGATIKTAITFDKINQSLIAVTGTAAAASTQMAYIRDVSKQAGLVITDVAVGYSRYLASAQAANQVVDETQRQFRIVSLAASKLQLSVEDTQGVFRALEQIMSKGKVQSEELRGQLGDRLPGAFAIAAKAMGYTTDQLSDLMKKGEVLSADFVPKFVSALQKAYNIDPTKNVDTIQASLNRATTAVQDFYLAFDTASGLSKTFKNAIEGMTSVLEYLTNNMNSLIPIVGILTGALAGLAAAWAVNAVIAWVSSVGGVMAIVWRTIAAVSNLTSAIMALNVAMLANPAGAVVRGLILITGAIVGAITGYNLLNSAVAENNAAMADRTAAEAFIASQNAMGQSIRQVTQDLLVQAKARLAASELALNAAQTAQGEAATRKRWVDKEAPRANIFALVDSFFANGRYRDTTAASKEALSNLARDQKVVNDLERMIANPPKPADSPVNGTNNSDRDQKLKQAQDNITAVEQMIDAYTAAKDKMAKINSLGSMQGGLLALFDLENVDDFNAAKDAIRGMSQNELAMAEAALKKMGLSTGDLVSDLAVLAEQTRKNNQQFEAFGQVWKNLERDSYALEGIKRQTEFLLQGGDPSKLFLVEAFSQATDALRKLDKDALEVIRQKLNLMGFEGKTAAEALANFFQQQDKGKKLVQTLSQVNDALREIKQTSADNQSLIDAYGVNAATGDVMGRLLKYQAQIRQFARDLEAAGETGVAAQAKLAEYAQGLLANDQLEQKLERQKQIAEMWRDVWVGAADNVIDSFVDVVTGAQNIGDAVQNLAMGFVRDVLQAQLRTVFADVLDQIGGKGGALTNALNVLTGGKTAGASAAAQAALTQANTNALFMLTQAVQLLTIRMGGQSGGGSGGILGAILNGVGMALGVPTTNINNGGFSIKSGAKTPGRARGGRVMPGQGYDVADRGSDAEIFFPGSPGSIVNLTRLVQNAGNPVFHIDASTVIDARGATPDAVEILRQEMKRRLQEQRDTLPTVIDSRMRENRMRLRQ